MYLIGWTVCMSRTLYNTLKWKEYYDSFSYLCCKYHMDLFKTFIFWCTCTNAFFTAEWKVGWRFQLTWDWKVVPPGGHNTYIHIWLLFGIHIEESQIVKMGFSTCKCMCFKHVKNIIIWKNLECFMHRRNQFRRPCGLYIGLYNYIKKCIRPWEFEHILTTMLVKAFLMQECEFFMGKVLGIYHGHFLSSHSAILFHCHVFH